MSFLVLLVLQNSLNPLMEIVCTNNILQHLISLSAGLVALEAFEYVLASCKLSLRQVLISVFPGHS